MKFHKKILKNGMRVMFVPMKNIQTVTVMVLVETGSEYENKKNNGISHFLEHMCFKGTERRPSAKIISQELDRIGAENNAFTGNEYTGYYAKAHQKHLNTILDVISDIYLNPNIPQAELEKEKGVIIEEINMYEDLPQRKVEDVLDNLLYGDQPAGFSIAGPKENIRKLAAKDLIQYRHDHYVAEATVLVVAGQFNEKKLLPLIEKTFKRISQNPKKKKTKTISKQSKPAIKIHFKATDQSHLRLAFRSFNIYDKRYWSLSLLSAILGNGMSSRLFQKMREELGICYYISASNRAHLDRGHFVISIGSAKERAGEAITAILAEVKKIKDKLVDDEELKKAKEYRIGHLFLNLEGSDDFADFYGDQEVTRQPILTPEECVKEIKKVTAKDIQKVAREIFRKEKINLAVVGPYKNPKQFLPLLKI